MGSAGYLPIQEVRHGRDCIEAKSQHAIGSLNKEHKKGNRERKAACRDDVSNGENLERGVFWRPYRRGGGTRPLGGLGICGRPFCCKTFLSDFAQVSIKMAKEQNLSLSSSKISGTCGRLMCCLRFEHDTYEREYATFPKVDSIIETANGRGVIVESNFLTGKIKAKMDGDAANVFRTYTKKEVRVVGRVKGNKADERTDVVPDND